MRMALRVRKSSNSGDAVIAKSRLPHHPRGPGAASHVVAELPTAKPNLTTRPHGQEADSSAARRSFTTKTSNSRTSKTRIPESEKPASDPGNYRDHDPEGSKI